jgi:hypothetical protein
VNQYFNDSTGIGDRGEPDVRGPWNEGDSWEFVEAPAFQELESQVAGTRTPANGSAGDHGSNGGSRSSGARREKATSTSSRKSSSKK